MASSRGTSSLAPVNTTRSAMPRVRASASSAGRRVPSPTRKKRTRRWAAESRAAACRKSAWPLMGDRWPIAPTAQSSGASPHALRVSSRSWRAGSRAARSTPFSMVRTRSARRRRSRRADSAMVGLTATTRSIRGLITHSSSRRRRQLREKPVSRREVTTAATPPRRPARVPNTLELTR